MHAGVHLRRLRASLAVALALALAATTLAPTDARAQVVGSSVTYTSDADFEQGQRVNLDLVDGTLRLREVTSTFPSIWVALSDRGTIARVDTLSGEILGEYLTAPEGTGRNPSRTTVGVDGTVWAGNRNSGYVVHVGIDDVNQCVDRNDDGVITTSSGYGDVLPWPAPTGEETPLTVEPEDECILHLVKPRVATHGTSRSMPTATCGCRPSPARRASSAVSTARPARSWTRRGPSTAVGTGAWSTRTA